MGFTRNFRNMLWNIVAGNSSSMNASGTVSGSVEDAYSLTDYNGTIKNFSAYLNGNYSKTNLNIATIFYNTEVYSTYGQRNTGIMFGTGTTAPSISDFRLDSLAETTITKVSSKVTTTRVDNNTVKRTVNFIVTAADTVTVNEWGYFAEYYYGSSSSYYSSYLVYRDVLKTPITLEAGVPTSITLEFDIPNPIPIE